MTRRVVLSAANTAVTDDDTDAGAANGAGSATGTPEEMLDFLKNATAQEADQWLDAIRNTPIDGDGKQEDNDVTRFLNAIGWTEHLPEVLTENAYQQAIVQAGNPTQLYHSDKPYGGTGARQFTAQFLGAATDFSGTPYRQYVSGGVYGDATYFADSASDSAYYGTSQVHGFLNSNAKVITSSALRAKVHALESKYPAFKRVFSQMGGKAGYAPSDSRLSVAAAMLGYNVIDANGGGYYAVIDRSAVTVSNKTVRARPGMRDW